MGPKVVCECCSDIDFNIHAMNNETEIGKITKKCESFLQEVFTDLDNFGVTFPIDLDVKVYKTEVTSVSSS